MGIWDYRRGPGVAWLLSPGGEVVLQTSDGQVVGGGLAQERGHVLLHLGPEVHQHDVARPQVPAACDVLQRPPVTVTSHSTTARIPHPAAARRTTALVPP